MPRTDGTLPAPPDNRPHLANWHLTVAYDGGDYKGWQIQSNVPTVQGALFEELRHLFPSPPERMIGTSRTDAAVHALDQHLSFLAPSPDTLSPERVALILNRRLPKAIRVLHSERRDDDFDARRSSVAKAYVYTLRRRAPCPPFEGRYVWDCSDPLDLPAVRTAAEELTGTRDFASFGVNPKRELDSTVRSLHRLDVVENGPYLHFVFLGDRFLYKMIRSIVGFLVDIGRKPGRARARVRATLAACDRSAAPETAPPQGLCLVKVFFEQVPWAEYRPPLPPHRVEW